jgi:hypothetical protein
MPPQMAKQMQQLQNELAAYQGPKGKIAIRAVQGTKGGPAVGGEEAELILLQQNNPVKRYPIQLDEQGVAIVSDVPLALELRPMVRVKHGGVFYQQVGDMLEPTKPNVPMEVQVFEVTETPPSWKVALRQVLFARNATGADVAETVVIQNPGDATWLGGTPDAQGRRSTVTLTLPPGASDVQLEQGFHGWCCTAFNGSDLAVQMPLMPGAMTYQFAYTVPAKDGQIDLRIVAPTTVDHAAIYVPEKDNKVQTTVLTPAGTELVDGQSSRIYQADAIAAGTTMGVVLTGIAPPAVAAAASDSKGMWIGIAAAGLVLGAIGVRYAMRPSHRPNEI